MMKKWQSIRTKMLVLLGGAALAATLGSCADGYDSPDGFDAGVKNTTMVTPNQIFIHLNQAGTEATIQWEMVKGCSGHEVTLLNIDDPENPVVVDGYDKRIVDGSRMTVPVQEDSHYKITMRTLGNKDLGNKDAENTLEEEFVTGVPSIGTIAGGTEAAPVNLNQWWADKQLAYEKAERAFDLEAGKYYEITDTLDLSIHSLTFRGNKNERPIVLLKEKGTITSCSGLKMKYINFDCTAMTGNSVFGMSQKEVCPDTILSQNLGYTKGTSLINDIYIVQDPWYIAHCWFKNIPSGFLTPNGTQCAWWALTIDDCIIQFDNEKNGTGFLALRASGGGGRTIKNVVISNSTLYNIKDNKSAYFAQYNNRNQARPGDVFGNATAEMSTASFVLSNCTLSKLYSGQKMGNDISYSSLLMESVLFYDVYGVRQFPRWCSNKTFKNNFWWDPLYVPQQAGGDNYDLQDLQTNDSGDAPMVKDYDFGWSEEQVRKPLDFSQPNGGVNFKPNHPLILQANAGAGAGDPRWLK